jgi:outer membrane protein OmpA-like peptidoglycan-associated protein
MGVALQKNKLPKKAKGPLFFWFFIVALVLSLAVHVFFLKKAGSWKVSGFAPEGYDEIVPRTFRMKRVEIDPKTVEEPAPTPSKKKERQPVTIEKETPQVISPSTTATTFSTLTKPSETILQEKPEATGENSQLFSEPMKKAATGEMGTSIAPTEWKDKTPLLPLDLEKNLPQPGTGTEAEKTPQFSSLDDLLAGGGQVSPSTAPILMPTDLLFEYDSSTLKPAAAESLAKLGTLISRNSEAAFRIEGHTDSFGSDAYNMELSVRRADEVKGWLQKNMGIPAQRITTAGYGKTRLLVPATLSIADQRMNRRVEIVITTPQSPQP